MRHFGCGKNRSLGTIVFLHQCFEGFLKEECVFRQPGTVTQSEIEKPNGVGWSVRCVPLHSSDSDYHCNSNATSG